MTRMTPGRYLQLRREAAGLSIDELPIEAAAARAIEDDVRFPYDLELQALRWSVPFDVTVLIALARGIQDRICRGCGCSQDDACMVADPGRPLSERRGCYWVESDLCSACADAARLQQEGLAL